MHCIWNSDAALSIYMQCNTIGHPNTITTMQLCTYVIVTYSVNIHCQALIFCPCMQGKATTMHHGIVFNMPGCKKTNTSIKRKLTQHIRATTATSNIVWLRTELTSIVKTCIPNIIADVNMSGAEATVPKTKAVATWKTCQYTTMVTS